MNSLYIGHDTMARALDAEPDPGIVTPGITYSDNMIVTLGGQDVEMIYTGVQTHTDEMSIIRFPGERTIDMSVYSDWISDDALRLRNIEGMYNMLVTNSQQQ